MNLALYRKYRPQNFSELVGQNHIKVTLQNEIAKKRVAHAYLFTGPRGIGKTTTARLLAKAVNCQKPKNSEPCNQCSVCQEIRDGRSIDLIEIDAASHTGVDNVRENIIENARFAPSRNKYKVFIIDEVHMLSISAFNALLKILEEPPAHVIFILATTEVHKLPETIISRCQRFDFKKINYIDIVNRLNWIVEKENVQVDKQILEMIARRAEGSIRDAESILGQILALGEKEIKLDQAMLILPRSDINLVFKFIEQLINRDTSNAIVLINQLLEEGVNLVQFNYELIEFLRKLILIKVVGSLDAFSALEFTKETADHILELSQSVDLNRLLLMINSFIEIEKDLKNATSLPQLPLELTVVKLCAEEGVEPAPLITANPIKHETIQEKTNQEKANKKTIKKNKANLSLKDLEKPWQAMLIELSKTNHSLALILKTCNLSDLDGDVLILGVGYQLYLEQLKKPKNNQLIEELLQKQTGSLIIIKYVFSEIKKDKDQAKPKTWDTIISTFGGKVVE